MNGPRAQARDGFTLVEVIVAMTLLAGILLSLAAMTFSTAQRALDIQATNSRQSVMLQEVNRLNALPWASLAGAAGDSVMSSGHEEFNRRVTVATAGRTATVQVILTSTRGGTFADTVTFTRSDPPTSNPLCFPSC